MSKHPLLQLKDLHVQVRTAHGLVDAVRGVSLSFERGDTMGLMGESGCGKSLTALALMGLLPEGAQVRGSLQWQGEECLSWSEDQWCKLRGNRWQLIIPKPFLKEGAFDVQEVNTASRWRLESKLCELTPAELDAVLDRLAERLGI